MTDATGHLPFWTLEQLAEGDLTHAERTLAEQHLRACAHCTAELASARALIAALAGLPALSPSAGFADAVMARVAAAPQAAAAAEPAEAARTGWLPNTVKGWIWLTLVMTAVMAPLAALGVWLAANPLVSVSDLFGVARRWAGEVAWNALVEGTGALARSGFFAWAGDMVTGLPGPATAGVPLALLLILAAIPVSAFVMVRTLKTPATGMTHAY